MAALGRGRNGDDEMKTETKGSLKAFAGALVVIAVLLMFGLYIEAAIPPPVGNDVVWEVTGEPELFVYLWDSETDSPGIDGDEIDIGYQEWSRGSPRGGSIVDDWPLAPHPGYGFSLGLAPGTLTLLTLTGGFWSNDPTTVSVWADGRFWSGSLAHTGRQTFYILHRTADACLAPTQTLDIQSAEWSFVAWYNETSGTVGFLCGWEFGDVSLPYDVPYGELCGAWVYSEAAGAFVDVVRMVGERL